MPSGLNGTNPMPSSESVGMISASGARHHSERAVHLSGVEEGDAPVDGGADQRNALLGGGHGQVALAQAHTSVTDGRDLQPPAERSRVHVETSLPAAANIAANETA